MWNRFYMFLPSKFRQLKRYWSFFTKITTSNYNRSIKKWFILIYCAFVIVELTNFESNRINSILSRWTAWIRTYLSATNPLILTQLNLLILALLVDNVFYFHSIKTNFFLPLDLVFDSVWSSVRAELLTKNKKII